MKSIVKIINKKKYNRNFYHLEKEILQKNTANEN